MFDKHKTKTMTKFLEKEKGRIVGLSIEPDGVFIYTRSVEWHNGDGSGTFVGAKETSAIKAFYRDVTKTSDDDRAFMEGR